MDEDMEELGKASAEFIVALERERRALEEDMEFFKGEVENGEAMVVRSRLAQGEAEDRLDVLTALLQDIQSVFAPKVTGGTAE